MALYTAAWHWCGLSGRADRARDNDVGKSVASSIILGYTTPSSYSSSAAVTVVFAEWQYI